MTPDAPPLWAALAGLITLSSCAPAASLPSTRRVPVRWQLVERRYQSTAEGGAAGDGRIDPEATVLALEPVYLEDLEEAFPPGSARLGVEIVDLFPGTEAGPGQPIAATVRVANASPRRRYRLRAQSLDPRVRILGESERTVKGPETATFRFTSGFLGKRGIAIEVEEVD